jgi:antitoxin VapB
VKETTIFQSGNSQAMRIPKEMRFTSEKVFIEKIGAVTVIVDDTDPWASLKLAQLLISKDFMQEGRSINKIVEREGLEGGLKR